MMELQLQSEYRPCGGHVTVLVDRGIWATSEIAADTVLRGRVEHIGPTAHDRADELSPGDEVVFLAINGIKIGEDADNVLIGIHWESIIVSRPASPAGGTR